MHDNNARFGTFQVTKWIQSMLIGTRVARLESSSFAVKVHLTSCRILTGRPWSVPWRDLGNQQQFSLSHVRWLEVDVRLWALDWEQLKMEDYYAELCPGYNGNTIITDAEERSNGSAKARIYELEGITLKVWFAVLMVFIF